MTGGFAWHWPESLQKVPSQHCTCPGPGLGLQDWVSLTQQVQFEPPHCWNGIWQSSWQLIVRLFQYKPGLLGSDGLKMFEQGIGCLGMHCVQSTGSQ